MAIKQKSTRNLKLALGEAADNFDALLSCIIQY